MRKWKTYSIIKQTDDWLAVSKPSGMASISSRDNEDNDLHTILQKRYGRLWIVHRIDKDTSGLILFAKNEVSHKQLSLLFESRKIQKTYLGIVAGAFVNYEGHIDLPIMKVQENKNIMCISKKGKASSTHYKVLDDFGLMSVVQFNLLTGRTHQIRLHTKYLGHPLLCDTIYGKDEAIYISQLKKKFHLSKGIDEQPILNRLALHSSELIFKLNDKEYQLQAPLFKDMRALIYQLRKNHSVTP